MAIHTISMFAGGGMLDQGVELAFGPIFRPIAYVECEAYAAGVLAAAMEGGRIHPAPVWSDARTVCSSQFRHYVREAGGIDAIIAGYPCPDFSCAGKRAGIRGVKGSLWWSLAEAIAEYEPELLFLENVGGHTSKGFDTVCSALLQMDYRIAAGLFTAAEVGASHKRERLFILAVSDGVREPQPKGYVKKQRRRSGDGDKELADAIGPGAGGQIGEAGRWGRTQGIRQGNGAIGPIRPTPANRELADANRRGTTTGQMFRLPLFPPGPNELDAWQAVLSVAPDTFPALSRAQTFAMRAVHAGYLDLSVVVRSIGMGKDSAAWLGKEIARAVAEKGGSAEFKRDIYKLADGMADRVQQLRLLGNGVMPLEAAYAYTTLGACLWGGI